jgi:c-di-GMP-binding flagellar brake protein YcgR
MADLHSDKREYNRVDTESDAMYKIIGEPVDLTGTGYFKTKTKNISSGGLCISAVRKILKGYIVKVGVEIETSEKPISAYCEVKWCAKSGAEYEAGLKFLNLQQNDAESINSLILKKTIN